MKKILITGAGSYIGTSFEAYLKENYPNDYEVDTLDMLDPAWRDYDFAPYDSVFHVAGIAHQRETKKNAHLYYEINRDLTVKVAEKAKEDGVKQFVFLSSMSVYGLDTGVITMNTAPNPKSNYGKSKLQAEELINELECDYFKVCILRPPMVFGKNCKGNFQTVVKFVTFFPVFPRIKNERSMIYIDNLSCFLKICVDEMLSGVFFPQNEAYIGTMDIARIVAKKLGKKRLFSVVLGGVIVVFRPLFPVLRKAFGTLIYNNIREPNIHYCVVDNATSIERSIR